MSVYKASTSECGGVLPGRRTSERGENAVDGRLAAVPRKKAVVLLSGGLDSATTLYHALSRGWQVLALIFDYGQRHRKEIRSAESLARRCRVPYHKVKISFPWKGSALLDPAAPLPENRMIAPEEIPATYVPARNIIFLSFAASCAEAVGARAVFIGANAVDYSGYPDCRPEFFAAFTRALDQGLKTGTEGRGLVIKAPLLKKSKAQILRMGMRLGVPYDLTWSCYRGGPRPCGVCDSCVLRARGFAAIKAKDPALKRKR